MESLRQDRGVVRSTARASAVNSNVHARRLALCLSVALTPSLVVAATSPWQPAFDPARQGPRIEFAARSNSIDALLSQPVTNCDDHGTGSLRDAISQAQPGGSIDLTSLQCSVITLDSEIAISQSSLYLKGPGQSALKISGAGHGRVIDHQGLGILGIQGMTIADGFYHAATDAYGGCIKSNGVALLLNATVQNCKVQGDAGHVSGGGVFAKQLFLQYSTISGNQVLAPADDNIAVGGGVSSDNGGVAVFSSSILGNSVQAGPLSSGGGIASFGSANNGLYLYASTLANNSAPDGAAVIAGGPCNDVIYSSTISDNSSSYGAVHDNALSLLIANSTIAFNHASELNGAGVLAGSQFETHSSIIANNMAGNVRFDVYLLPGATWSGTNNLVTGSVPAAPPGVVTISTDPELGPLQPNGGFTATRELMANSPAIAAGDNLRPFPFDQRDGGYPRSTGANQTVDIGAVQFDTIFADLLD